MRAALAGEAEFAVELFVLDYLVEVAEDVFTVPTYQDVGEIWNMKVSSKEFFFGKPGNRTHRRF